ncbi:ATP-binding protein [Desulfovibrio sp. UCD-KL4C]|uniref:ATP-binding protein n=1 Tax=Desulfovibrio sp. UCD-KL4C TaxID=2578120 RepID=UPI0025BBCD04|nr:ATP-binding protein [Desulfovibrio sp. UCD-KL4C]
MIKKIIRKNLLNYYPSIALGLIILSFVFFLGILIFFDSYEDFYHFTRKHESWNLDDILMGLVITLSFLGPISLIVSHRIMVKNESLKDGLEFLRAELEHKKFMERTRYDLINNLSIELKKVLNLSLKNTNQEILLNSGSLERLIDKITTVCSIGSDYSTKNKDEIHFHPILRDIKQNLKLKAKTIGAEIHFLVQTGFPNKCYGNEYAILQLITEILHDAMERSRHGLISVQLRHASFEEIVKTIEIRVSNIGDPVPKEKQKLFDYENSGSYFRTHQTFNPNNHLVLAYWLILMIEGEITVLPNEHGGSIITLTFQVTVDAPE